MKLAEALISRADHQRRLERLKLRLLRIAKVQEGDKPAEKPGELLKEIERLSESLVRLIQRINATNSSTMLAAGQTITDAIAIRDILKLRYNVYIELAKAAAITQGRTTKSEVKFKSTVEIVEIQKKADELAKEYRKLDTKIQEANWLTDLKE